MALSTGSAALASDFNGIRDRVIAEFNATNRRNVSTNYQAPASARSSGNSLSATDVNNIAKDLYYVNSNTYSSNGITAGTELTMMAMDSALTIYEGCSKQGNASGCESGCVGLCEGCTGGCGTGCSSCTGTCEGGCKGCSGYCANSCTANCADCTGTCNNTCIGGCGANCYPGCWVNEY